MLPVLTPQTLEVRRRDLTSSMWTTFGRPDHRRLAALRADRLRRPVSTSSFSFSNYDNITRLPYTAVHFNALYIKILVFLIMTGAGMVLAYGHVLHDEVLTSGDRPAGSIQVRTLPVGVSQRALRGCLAVMVGGSGVIGICVTILKYCHELIETATAARILGGG